MDFDRAVGVVLQWMQKHPDTLLVVTADHQTGGMLIKDGKPVWNGKCVHCMACICSCPTEAIEYGSKSKGQPRYTCPM